MLCFYKKRKPNILKERPPPGTSTENISRIWAKKVFKICWIFLLLYRPTTSLPEPPYCAHLAPEGSSLPRVSHAELLLQHCVAPRAPSITGQQLAWCQSSWNIFQPPDAGDVSASSIWATQTAEGRSQLDISLCLALYAPLPSSTSPGPDPDLQGSPSLSASVSAQGAAGNCGRSSEKMESYIITVLCPPGGITAHLY